jgi:hypothetical protein
MISGENRNEISCVAPGLETRRRAVRPALVVAALGAALSGCGLPQDGYGRPNPYSYSSPGYYSSPGSYSSHRNHHRSESLGCGTVR